MSAAPDDSSKVRLYASLCYHYALINPAKGIDYAESGRVLAEKLGWKKGLTLIYNNLARPTG